jgi:hypothetical protein
MNIIIKEKCLIIQSKYYKFTLGKINYKLINKEREINIRYDKEDKNKDDKITIYFTLLTEQKIIDWLKTYYEIIFDGKSYINYSLEIDTNNMTDTINWFLKKNIFQTVIFGQKYDKINHEITFVNFEYSCYYNYDKIKNVIYKNRLLYSINILPKNLTSLTIRFKTFKNFKITLPEKLKSIKLNELVIDLTGSNIKDVGIINKKEDQDILPIINSNLLCLYKYEKDIININNLSSNIKILYLLDNFNESIDSLPDGIEKIVLGKFFNKSIANIPITIKNIELKYEFENPNFINELHDQIENLTFKINKMSVSNHDKFFDNIKFPKLLKNLKFVVFRKFTRIKDEFIRILDYHVYKNKLGFKILFRAEN